MYPWLAFERHVGVLLGEKKRDTFLDVEATDGTPLAAAGFESADRNCGAGRLDTSTHNPGANPIDFR
jgi:hypothetical protein